MVCGETTLEDHLTTYAFLQINTRVSYVAQYHAKWLVERYDRETALALLPDPSYESEFTTLTRYFLLQSVISIAYFCDMVSHDRCRSNLVAFERTHEILLPSYAPLRVAQYFLASNASLQEKGKLMRTVSMINNHISCF